jgi:O-antigen/teichoic acid export membrane protein
MRSLLTLARTRLAQGTAAGFYGLIVQLLVQLISVPVLVHSWGVAGYGAWVMLFAVPSLLAMADLGLTTAGANAMTEAAAKGDRPRAARIHMALRLITALTGLALLTLAALFIYWLNPEALNFGEAMPREVAARTALLLCLYGFLALFNGVTQAGFRAADAFASSGMLFHTLVLIEAVVAMGIAIAGGSPAEVALAYLLARLAGTMVFSLVLKRTAPWLGGNWTIDWGEVKDLLRPALAALVLPGAQAVSIQGSVVAIGAIGGPAAVPAFSVVRTLSRTALQFAFRFNVASMPRYTVFVAQGNRERASQLVLLNLGIAALLVIPAALGLLLLGRPFIHLWTGGLVVPSFALLAVMVLTMLADAVWFPLSNLILSINRHGLYTYHYLIAATLSVPLGALLVKDHGALGMAWALLGLELAMILRTWQIARRLGMLHRADLAGASRNLIAELRAGRTSLKDTAP